jgi:multidrug efflux pump subunit AcrA (membrane-fusion protein)
MKKIYILIFLLSVWLISGCANNSSETIKQDFFVDTMILWSKDQQSFLIKPGKIVWSQDITVSAQANGRISNILVKEWDYLLGWKQVMLLADTIANYSLQVQSAKNWLDRAILTYEQNKNLLDQQLQQTKLAYEQAKNSYDVTSKIAQNSLKKADIDIRNSDTNIWNLKLQLNIEKTNNINIIDNVLYQADTIFGVSDKYKHMNDAFEIYLWAKDSSKKNALETLILKMYKTKENVELIKTNDISEQDIYDAVNIIATAYSDLNVLLDNVVVVLQNSVASVALSQASIDWYINSFNIQKNTLQSLNNAFTAYRKQIESGLWVLGSWFVDNTKETIEISYESTVTNIQNSIFNAELWLKNAKLALETLEANYDNQLGLLNNAIESARIWYMSAMTQYNKLSVRAPIAWTIWNILVDKWQEVSMGMPLFTISNNDSQLIEIYVSFDEYKYINAEQSVLVYYNNDDYISGTVVSIGSIVSRDFSYKIVVALLGEREVLWDTAKVHIPLDIWKNVLPLSSVVVTKQNEWYINIIQNNQLKIYPVEFGNIWWEFIEIKSVLPDSLEVVLSVVDNFDPEEFVLKVRN